MERKAIPNSVRQQVLTESGYRCAVPTCRTILTIDLHHIIKVSEDGENDSSNLIALCPNCHALHHRGDIPIDSIKVWKAMLISLNGAFDKATIDDLIFLKKVTPKTLAISGDGVLKFSKLIAAELASYSILMQNGPIINYEVQLTPKGKLLIDAWEKGNNEELKRYL